MAEQVTTVLTVRVAGTDRVVKSLAEAEKAAAELRQEIANVPKGGREFVRLNQDLERLENNFSGVAQQAGTATKAAEKGTRGFAGALKLVGSAINGLGLLALLPVIQRVLNFFGKFAPVADLVEDAMAGLGTAVAFVVDRLGKLLQGDILGAFGGFASGLSASVRESVRLTAELRDLEDALRLIELQSARTNLEVQRLLISARDRTKDFGERLKLLEQAGELEEKQAATELDNAKATRDALLQKVKADKAAFQALLDQQNGGKRLAEVTAQLEAAETSLAFIIRNKNADYENGREAALNATQARVNQLRAERDALTESAASTDGIVNQYLEAEKRVIALEGQTLNLQETISNRRNLIAEQQAAAAEGARAKAQAARDKEAEAQKKLLDEELAAFNARLDFEAALVAGRTDTAAKLRLLDIEIQKQREAFRIAELKGEVVLNDAVLKAEVEYSNARRRLLAEEAATRQAAIAERVATERAAIAELAQLQADTAKAAAEAEAQDLTLPIEQRIDAVLRLRAIELERIEATRAAALSEENLSRAQIDLINAQAEAAIEATEGITDAAEESLLGLQGSVIARIFGVGSEEQIEQTKQALRELADAGVQILSDLGTTLFDAQAQRLEAQAAQFAEAVAAAEQESADAATRTAELQANLAQADVSQRSRIIGLIKEQQAAQARADSAAAAARAREVAAKTKAAQGQRRADSVQALVNAALAITRVFASTPPPASFILAAATAATTGAQIAAINSQPLPTFAQGGFTGNGTGPIDRTGERIAGITHAGEYVVPRRVLAIPQARGVVDYLEGLRTFAQGGFTTPDQGTTTTTTPAAAPVVAAPPVRVELVLTDVASGLQRVQLAERKATL